MLTIMQYLIFISLIIIGNSVGYFLNIYYPNNFLLHIFNTPFYIILANTLYIIFILGIFNLLKSISLTNDKKAIYSDTALLEAIPNVLCIKDKKGRWLAASQQYLDLMGLSEVSYKGKKDKELAVLSGAYSRALRANVIQDRKSWQQRKAIKENKVMELGDQQSSIIEITSTPIFNDKQEPLRLLVSSENLLQNTELILLKNIFNDSLVGLALLDKQFKIELINQQFSILTGYSNKQARAKPITFLHKNVANKMQSEIISFFNKDNSNHQVWSRDIFCSMKNGKNSIIQLKIKAASKDKEYYFATLLDITVQKQYEKRITQADYCDNLTGLVGRTMYLTKLKEFISNAIEHKSHAIVCVLDLELFKSVNDSLGYNASEQILIEVANRLQAISDKSHIVSRFRGDEFAILILNEDSYEKAIFTASIQTEKITKTLSRAFIVEGNEIVISASIGIAIFPENGHNAEELIQNADLAMSHAKTLGTGEAQFYNNSLLLVKQERLAMEQKLRKAISRYELELFYQPQYTAATKVLWGAEVLIRWTQDPQGNPVRVPPDTFIPIAEETGLIIEIGHWILRTACLQMKKWIDNEMPIKQVSVNVSAKQFMDKNFLGSVESALEEANLPAKHLEIELTETMLVGDPSRIELQLKRLNKMGIRIALDDFGTGYSSLAYLKKFPIDILKIDQSFIREMTPTSKDAKIVKTIINMAHALNQKVIAEGVENAEQLEFLRKNKCDIIQGYYFSKPLSVYMMSTLLAGDKKTVHFPVKKESY